MVKKKKKIIYVKTINFMYVIYLSSRYTIINSVSISNQDGFLVVISIVRSKSYPPLHGNTDRSDSS